MLREVIPSYAPIYDLAKATCSNSSSSLYGYSRHLDSGPPIALRTHLHKHQIHACIDCTLLVTLTGISYQAKRVACQIDLGTPKISSLTRKFLDSPVIATMKLRRGSVPLLSIFLISCTAVNPSLQLNRTCVIRPSCARLYSAVLTLHAFQGPSAAFQRISPPVKRYDGPLDPAYQNDIKRVVGWREPGITMLCERAYAFDSFQSVGRQGRDTPRFGELPARVWQAWKIRLSRERACKGQNRSAQMEMTTDLSTLWLIYVGNLPLS